MVITEKIKKMQTAKGFYELWIKEVGKGKTHKEAFQALEQEYEEIWGFKRYRSFESFRISQYQRISTN